MSEHHATISWTGGSEPFTYETYPRDHSWRFPCGVSIDASAAPGFKGSESRIDPEEAFVASVASCHMLTFLAVAARRDLVVTRYEDSAVGYLEKNAEGRLAITRVVLEPRVTFGGDGTPDAAAVARLHERAHHGCFIANSIRTEVVVE